MATKFCVKLCNVLVIWWWIVNFILGLGIPTVVESRYLPTRRSSPSDDRFDRLRELLHDILESDTHSALTSSSSSSPTYQQLSGDRELAIRKKSDDIFSASMTKYNNDVSPGPRSGNRALYAKTDDYDFDGVANRREPSTSSIPQTPQQQQQQQLLLRQQQQQQQQPWRFILLNYGGNHSQKPSKSLHSFTLNQSPMAAAQHRNLHPFVKKSPSYAAASSIADQSHANSGGNDVLNENLDWINSGNNNDDYDLLYDANAPPQNLANKFRFRRNSNPTRQTFSWRHL